jgi:hypothetical protein
MPSFFAELPFAPSSSTVLASLLFMVVLCAKVSCGSPTQDVHLLVELRALQRDTTSRVTQWDAMILESRLSDGNTSLKGHETRSADEEWVKLFFATPPSGVTTKNADAPQRSAVMGIFQETTSETRLVHAMPLDAAWLGPAYFDGIHHHHDHHDHHAELHGGQFPADNTTVRVVTVRGLSRDGLGSTRLLAVVSHSHHDVMDACTGGYRRIQHRGTAYHTLAYSAATTLVMSQRGIVLTTLQLVGRTTTRSITFLASGYLASQQTKFNTDVATCVAALKGQDASLDASPWPRYFPLLNVYSLFAPSVGSGASREVGPRHACGGMITCGPLSVNNNLGCSFGTPDPAQLGCHVPSVLSLASFAPSVDIVVVLVNDADVGASAFRSYATLSTATLYMTYQLVHQLNHAVAGLGDEYSYGLTEPNPLTLSLPANCAYQSNAALVNWSYWVTQGTVAAAPLQGCTYDNLYRPTDNSCIMRTPTATSMCSVCKEQLLLSLYSGGMSIDGPRCPPANWNIFVNASDTVTLTVNQAFVLQNAAVTVLWILQDGSTVTTNVPSMTVSGSSLQAGVNTIRAIITDASPLIRTSLRPSAMNITTTFTLRLWQASSGCVTDTCTSSSNVAYSYCRVCNAADGCPDALVVPVTYADPVARDVDQDTYIVNITAIVTAAVGGGILMCSVLVHVLYRSKKPNLIYDPSSGERALSIVVIITAAISLIMIVVMIVFAVLYLPRAAVFGRGFFIGVIVIAVLLYLIAIFKLVASIFSSAPLTAVCGVLLCTFGIGLFGIGVYGVYIYHNRDTTDIMDNFAGLWRDYTASNPDLICDIQSAFQCSGFYHSCTPTASSDCPSNCAQPNRDYVNACSAPWMNWIVWNALRVGVVGLVCGFFFAIAAVIDCIHCVRTMRAKANARGRRSYRRDERAPVVPITNKEVQQFRAEFAKADSTNKGTLEGEELLAFIEDTFGEPPSSQERSVLMTAGPMSCEELLRMYFPYYVLSQMDPRQLTPEEAEGAHDGVDLQRLQFAKLEMFMAAAGSLSPETLQRIYQNYAKTHFATTGRELLDLIRSEAMRHSVTEEAAMCSGLSKQELEGLRGAWISIHPAVVGDLDDDELDKLFQWTHGTVLHSHEHFVRWKDMLDVRKTDSIGWGEFCYPFAQRARLGKAREYLYTINREVPHEMLSKAQVAEEFGPHLVDQCFMVFEEIIPVERVVERAIKLQDGEGDS